MKSRIGTIVFRDGGTSTPAGYIHSRDYDARRHEFVRRGEPPHFLFQHLPSNKLFHVDDAEPFKGDQWKP